MQGYFRNSWFFNTIGKILVFLSYNFNATPEGLDAKWSGTRFRMCDNACLSIRRQREERTLGRWKGAMELLCFERSFTERSFTSLSIMVLINYWNYLTRTGPSLVHKQNHELAQHLYINKILHKFTRSVKMLIWNYNHKWCEQK